MANCDQIYGQKWQNLWQNKIVGMAAAMAIVAILGLASILGFLLQFYLLQSLLEQRIWFEEICRVRDLFLILAELGILELLLSMKIF